MKQSIMNFVQDVGSEMKKVSWPNRSQLQESTVVTVVVCMIITVFVYVVDLIFTQVFKILY
jgi:preprotein translocase subunit SecE